MGLDGNLALAESGHDHPDNLTDTPPHKDHANDNGDSIGEDFNDGGNGHLSGDCVNNGAESGTGNSGTGSQTYSFRHIMAFTAWMREEGIEPPVMPD